jgi:hypothetical protein
MTGPRSKARYGLLDGDSALHTLLGLDSSGPRLRALLTLRPYGDRLLTPAARVWLASAWIVILLMASIEGFVWGAVGASLVPAATPWLAPPVALFMFLLMFSVIWIVDASLIMSERPTLRLRPGGDGESGAGPTARWLSGLVIRLCIVAISLFVTAPFIEKLVRADDIAGWHQQQVERYYAERAETLREQVAAQVAQLDTGYQGRIETLESQIATVNETLAAERQRRSRLEEEYAPELDVLRRDLAEARGRVGDEVLGRNGRPEGYGPEARKWSTRADMLADVLAEKQAKLDERLTPVQAGIDAQQQRLNELSQTLGEVRAEQQALVQRVTDQVSAEMPPPEPPKLTFAARSKGLTALRESPAEAGVPHFETVEGFAQAALGILFFALIALKLFEPPAVRAYFSEGLQERYGQYVAGGLAHVPGFAGHDDPAQRLTPVQLLRRWEQWQRDPNAYVDAHKAAFAAEARVRRMAADRDYEVELLARRREGIDHELALDRQRREAELRAREEEIEARLEQLKQRLADASRVQRERDALALDEQRRQQAEDTANAVRVRRERRIVELEQALDQAREQLAAHRAGADALHQARTANLESLFGTRARIDELTAQIEDGQRRARALRERLPDGADDVGGLLAGWLPRAGDGRRYGRERRRLRELERDTVQLLRERDSQRGRLAVLELERDRLDATAATRHDDIESAHRRCEDLRRRLDRVLLHPEGQMPGPPGKGGPDRAADAGGDDYPPPGGPARIRSV